MQRFWHRLCIQDENLQQSGNQINSNNKMSIYLQNQSSFEGYPLQVRHKQDWGRGFILLLPQAVVLPESDAGGDGVKPA